MVTKVEIIEEIDRLNESIQMLENEMSWQKNSMKDLAGIRSGIESFTRAIENKKGCIKYWEIMLGE